MTAPADTGGAPVVIGVGEEFLHDDGVGPAVIAELRRSAAAGALPPEARLEVSFGEPAGLIELWRDARLAIVVDATAPDPRAGLAPGDVVRWEAEYTSTAASESELGAAITGRGPAGRPPAVTPGPGPAATHGLGPGAAIALARVLDRLPRRLVLFAVAGADFSPGPGLSPQVADAVRDVARTIAAEVRRQGLSTPARRDLLSWSGGGARPRLEP